jgi:hypothetical protein
MTDYLPPSGGVFLSRGYRRIALPPSPRLKDTLIHELTHNRLAHLHSPIWLAEGLAATMERRVGGNRHGRLDRELYQKHKEHWSSDARTGTPLMKRHK